MFIEAMVGACDINSTSYERPVKGVAAVARGASGRWCEVMWFGPEWVAKNNPKVTSYDEAVAKIEAEGDWADF